jgi:hypothetical protein
MVVFLNLGLPRFVVATTFFNLLDEWLFPLKDDNYSDMFDI